MSAKTSIEWTDRTWNPVRGCSRISTGCEHCYAEGVAARFSGPGLPYEGLATKGKNGPRWTGRVRTIEEALVEPLTWRAPAKVFVNSMSDLFHEEVSDEDIEAIFGVMASAGHHTFQVLTKRSRRMQEFMEKTRAELCAAEMVTREIDFDRKGRDLLANDTPGWPWPPPNVWLGVSVENQECADARIPDLLATKAAVRFLSCEPLLGPVDLGRWLGNRVSLHCEVSRVPTPVEVRAPRVQWVIIGGESGPRPMDLEWARSIVRQCRDTGTPVFVKQLGSVPMIAEASWRANPRLLNAGNYNRVPPGFVSIATLSRKGGDLKSIPEDLRIREFPEVRT